MPATDIEHMHRGVCTCCGSHTALTRGAVFHGSERVAGYLVKWSVGAPAHGMGWLVSLPLDAGGRSVAVSLRYSFEHQSFMIRRCGDEPWTHDELAGLGELLDRDEVIGTDLAPRVFSLVDDIWQTDPYVREFVASAQCQGCQDEG